MFTPGNVISKVMHHFQLAFVVEYYVGLNSESVAFTFN